MTVIQYYLKASLKQLCLSKDKFNKWLKKPERKYNDPPKGTCCCLELYDLVRAELGKRSPSGSAVSSLKHKLSKREYNDVVSKTYIGAILLMHMYQGKGRWGFIAE